MRAVGIAFAACVGLAALVVATRDPDESWAVGLFILAVGGASAAFATWLQLRRRPGRRGPRGVTAVAGRRGLEIGAIVALLLWLRAVDGLSPVTAAFVVGTFVLTEVVLAARPNSSR